MAVEITASVISTDLPLVALAVTGFTPGESVGIGRYVAGVRTWVRGAEPADIADDALVRFDAEHPFGVSVYYVAEVEGAEADTTTPTVYTLPSGLVILSDAITGQSAEVTVVDWDEKRYERKASLFRVGGRTVVVSGLRGQFTAEITLVTETDAARLALSTLLDTATAGVLQLRQSGGYDDIDCYFAVLTESRRRVNHRVANQRRLWPLEIAETQAWAPELSTMSFTFADVDAAYAGLTFADLDVDYAGLTFVDFDLTDWSL